jgi:hypothetical protein
MWDRNPNTGHKFAQDAVLKIADQTIFHDADHPSEVTLPIVSEDDAESGGRVVPRDCSPVAFADGFRHFR